MTVTNSEKARLSPIEWLALQLVGKEVKSVRDDVPVGRNQKVDILVRVQGQVHVAADTTTTTKEGPKADVVLAHVLALLPAEQRTLICGQVNDLYQIDNKLPIDAASLATAKGLLARMQKSVTSDRKGPTTGAFNVGLVDMESLNTSVTLALTKNTRAITFGEE